MSSGKNGRGGARRGAGRKPTGRAFCKKVQLRLNAEEAAALEEAAKGEALATYAKRALLEYIARDAEEQCNF